MTSVSYSDARDARLGAIAGARAVLLGDATALDCLLDTGDPKALAGALAEMAASLLLLFPHDQVLGVLDKLTAAAIGPDGATA